MILAYKNANFQGQKGFLSMNYRTNNSFWQGVRPWPKTVYLQETSQLHQNFRYLSSPAQIQTVPTSTALMPATSPSQNVWAKTRLSTDYTVKPAATASANARAHSWQAQNYQKKLSFESSSVLDMAVPSKQPQISVRLIRERLNGFWKKPADVQKISTSCNWRNYNSRLKQYNLMNCTGVLLNSQKRGKTKKAKASSERPCVGSYGVGSCESFCDRFASWSSHSRNRLSIDCIGGCLLSKDIASASYRRPFALSCGHSAGFWKDKASPKTQERSWQKMQTSSQAATKFAGWRSQEDSKFQRQTARSYHLCFVWPTQRYRTPHSAIEDWSQDKYFSSGKTQWHIERSANSPGQTNTQRISVGLCVSMVVVALARFVQLDKGASFSEWADTCDVPGSFPEYLDGVEICSLSCSCQRAFARSLGRTTQESLGIAVRCLST